MIVLELKIMINKFVEFEAQQKRTQNAGAK